MTETYMEEAKRVPRPGEVLGTKTKTRMSDSPEQNFDVPQQRLGIKQKLGENVIVVGKQ